MRREGLSAVEICAYQISRPIKTMLTTSQANKPAAMKFSRLTVMLMPPGNDMAPRQRAFACWDWW